MTYSMVLKFNTCHAEDTGRFCETRGGRGGKETPSTGKKTPAKKPEVKEAKKPESKKQKTEALPAQVKVSTTQAALKEPEAKALLGYTLSGYREVNALLRGQSPEEWMDFKRAKAISDSLDSAINKATLDEDVTVYRGLGTKYAEAMTVGSEVVDSGYASTSSKLSEARKFAREHGGVVVQVRVPKGTHLLDVNKAMGRPSGSVEAEHLLPRGTRYKVISNTGTSVVLEVLP